jgi:hypothetical protein
MTRFLLVIGKFCIFMTPPLNDRGHIQLPTFHHWFKFIIFWTSIHLIQIWYMDTLYDYAGQVRIWLWSDDFLTDSVSALSFCMYIMCRYVMECTGLFSFWLWSFDFSGDFRQLFQLPFIVSIGLHTFTLNSNYIWVHHMIVQVRFEMEYGPIIFFTELYFQFPSLTLVCLCSYVIGMRKSRSPLISDRVIPLGRRKNRIFFLLCGCVCGCRFVIGMRRSSSNLVHRKNIQLTFILSV